MRTTRPGWTSTLLCPSTYSCCSVLFNDLSRVVSRSMSHSSRFILSHHHFNSVCKAVQLGFSFSAAHYSSLSPPAGSCPPNKPSSSKPCKKSQRSTSVCPWRTRSCCGSCTMATCWQAPAASRPPRPSTRLVTPPPSPPQRPYRPDNGQQPLPLLWPTNNPHPVFFKLDKYWRCSKYWKTLVQSDIVGYQQRTFGEVNFISDSLFWERQRHCVGTDALKSERGTVLALQLLK